jgi:hypothetical protein
MALIQGRMYNDASYSYAASSLLPIWSLTISICLVFCLKIIHCLTPKGSDVFAVHIHVSYLILPAALDPGAYSASNTNEYQKQTNNVSGE